MAMEVADYHRAMEVGWGGCLPGPLADRKSATEPVQGCTSLRVPEGTHPARPAWHDADFTAYPPHFKFRKRLARAQCTHQPLHRARNITRHHDDLGIIRFRQVAHALDIFFA